MKIQLVQEHPMQIYPYMVSIEARTPEEFFAQVRSHLTSMYGTPEMKLTGFTGNGIVTVGARGCLFCHNLRVKENFFFTKDSAHRIHHGTELQCEIESDEPMIFYFETRNKMRID